MGSGRGEKKPLQICREPAHIRGQIAGTADILLPICHLEEVLENARSYRQRPPKESENIHFKWRSRQVRLDDYFVSDLAIWRWRKHPNLHSPSPHYAATVAGRNTKREGFQKENITRYSRPETTR